MLKSEFNTAWNYFNAKELGETVTGYWSEWLERASRGEYNSDFPACIEEENGTGESYAPAPCRSDPGRRVPDVRLSNVFTARWLVSRKRTTNLMDLASLWKKTVLENLERRVVAEIDESTNPSTLDSWVVREPSGTGTSSAVVDSGYAPLDGAEIRFTDVFGNYIVNLGRREDSPDSDDEMNGNFRRRSPPAPSAWHGASL